MNDDILLQQSGRKISKIINITNTEMSNISRYNIFSKNQRKLTFCEFSKILSTVFQENLKHLSIKFLSYLKSPNLKQKPLFAYDTFENSKNFLSPLPQNKRSSSLKRSKIEFSIQPVNLGWQARCTQDVSCHFIHNFNSTISHKPLYQNCYSILKTIKPHGTCHRHHKDRIFVHPVFRGVEILQHNQKHLQRLVCQSQHTQKFSME